MIKMLRMYGVNIFVSIDTSPPQKKKNILYILLNVDNYGRFISFNCLEVISSNTEVSQFFFKNKLGMVFHSIEKRILLKS